MSLELKGKIVHVLPVVEGAGRNGNTWKKQEYVIEIPGQYPKKVCFSAWGEKVDSFAIRPEEELTVSFDVESREYNGRWYTEVRAWKVSRGGDAQSAPVHQGGGYGNDAPSYQPSSYTAPAQTTPVSEAGDGLSDEGSDKPNEDLPF